MLVYQLMRIRYLLTIKALDIIPDINFDFPDYHDDLVNIICGLGYFIDLSYFSKLFAILVGYMSVRIALAFYHSRK